jgi:hypothetical protein
VHPTRLSKILADSPLPSLKRKNYRRASKLADSNRSPSKVAHGLFTTLSNRLKFRFLKEPPGRLLPPRAKATKHSASPATSTACYLPCESLYLPYHLVERLTTTRFRWPRLNLPSANLPQQHQPCNCQPDGFAFCPAICSLPLKCLPQLTEPGSRPQHSIRGTEPLVHPNPPSLACLFATTSRI